ncbi:hypothetical protein KGQ72_01425 [Patescibacteria group bacterium]|nr:hypothetical protein [Patescibacteria group bacterium]
MLDILIYATLQFAFIITILVIVFILFLVLALLLFINGAQRNADKLMFGLPLLKWVSLRDAIEMGHSEYWCKKLLPVFYKNGYLQIRPHSKLPESRQKMIVKLEFNSATVELFDFRLMKQGGRRKRRLWPFSVAMRSAPA